MLKTRHFVSGEISILAEFQPMRNKLTAKDPLLIDHVEVPDILIAEMIPQPNTLTHCLVCDVDKIEVATPYLSFHLVSWSWQRSCISSHSTGGNINCILLPSLCDHHCTYPVVNLLVQDCWSHSSCTYPWFVQSICGVSLSLCQDLVKPHWH